LSDWHRQSWDKMLLENADDMVHVLSLKATFLYMSPSCRQMLEYDAGELENRSVSEFCHPSDLVGVERTLKEASVGEAVNFAWRIMRKNSGYMWIESYGSLFADQGKGRKCVILVGRQRPVVTLSRRSLEEHGGIGDNDIWSKMSTSGMFLFVSSNVRSLLDHRPQDLVGTSIQDMMRKESRPEFGRAIEKARKGRIMTCKHEVQHNRGQVLHAHTILYPGDVAEGKKPTFLIAQTKLVKVSAASRTVAPAIVAATAAAAKSRSVGSGVANSSSGDSSSSSSNNSSSDGIGASTTTTPENAIKSPSNSSEALLRPSAANTPGSSSSSSTTTPPNSSTPAMQTGPSEQEIAQLLHDARDNLFDELSGIRPSSWQYELRQMEINNRLLAEELVGLLSNKKKRKRRKGVGNAVRDCANCHIQATPEWRRGPSGNRDLCNSCGLRWAKQVREPLSVYEAFWWI